jgi:1,4-alpha-glucan branching enzyme
MPRTSTTPRANGAAKKIEVVAPVAAVAAGRKRVTFKIVAPQASDVKLCGSFNEWDPIKHPLKKDTTGVWKTQVTLPPGTYEYRYLVDGEWRDDPDANLRVPNPFGSENCVREI